MHRARLRLLALVGCLAAGLMSAAAAQQPADRSAEMRCFSDEAINADDRLEPLPPDQAPPANRSRTCFFLVRSALSWPEADLYCQRRLSGARLASISSAARQRLVERWLLPNRYAHSPSLFLWLAQTEVAQRLPR